MEVGFVGAQLDRADLLRTQPDRIAALANLERARMMRISGLDPQLDGEGRLQWDRPELPPEQLIFLGIDDGAPLFAPLASSAGSSLSSSYPVGSLISAMEGQELARWGAVRSLLAWHARHAFCSNCGERSQAFRAGWGRKCPACSAEHYPRVDPVVIMLAEFENRILLARQPHYPPGRYSALAGFVEPGESIEEAVAREFDEEASLPVSAIQYMASQTWPFPGSLMIACIAKARTDAVTLDRTELEDSIWVTREEVRAALAGEANARFQPPPHYAIAHTLLRHWLAGGDCLA